MRARRVRPLREETRPANRRGMSLIEVMVAVTLLGVAMLSLGAAAGLGVSQMGAARQDLQYTADVQQQIDSLSSLRWNAVTSGSANVRGRPFVWTVTSPTVNSRLVTVVVQRKSQRDPTRIFRDTVVMYLANPRPGS